MSTETLQEMENILKLQKKHNIEEGPASIELRKDRLNRCIAMLKEYMKKYWMLSKKILVIELPKQVSFLKLFLLSEFWNMH